MNTSRYEHLTVLVADDMKTMRSIVTAILNSIGITQIVEAKNGVEALAKIKQSPIDLVICDWDMPQLCGIDVLKVARRSADSYSIHFIMLTSNSGQGFIKLAQQYRVDEYVCKPIQAAVLEQKIVNVLERMNKKIAV
ncbi:MAG: response regulator [Gammaproteobacteria bacterium]|nr:response regulator [Gammaproteobacteria bacterium]